MRRNVWTDGHDEANSRFLQVCQRAKKNPDKAPQITSRGNFDVFLTVHLSIFISVFYQLDVQNLFYNKFYFMLLHVSSTCAHQEVKIALQLRGIVG
jgi:hypothetical protein